MFLLPVGPLGGRRRQVDRHERRGRVTPDASVPRVYGAQGVDSGFLHSQVPEVGLRTLLRGPLKQFLGGQEARDGRGRIVDVARDYGLFGANHHAGGFQPHLDAVHAVVALLGGLVHGIDVQRVVGTGLHAAFAADTQAGVEVDDPVGSAE